MADEGVDEIFARHAACAAAARAGLDALGFQLFADPAHRSQTVTAAWVPDGLDWKAFNTDLKRRKLVLAGGQGKLTGKILRVGHLGTVTLDEILACIGVLEEVSLIHGRDVVPGSAVAAAQRAGVEALGIANAVAAGA
jgi:serine---pyruvate transaminase